VYVIEKQVITEIITTNRKTRERKKNKQNKSMVILALQPKYRICGIFSSF
jgi:hypothetical protein